MANLVSRLTLTGESSHLQAHSGSRHYEALEQPNLALIPEEESVWTPFSTGPQPGPRRLKLCDICKNIFAAADSLDRLHSDSGVVLCRGNLAHTRCSLLSMAGRIIDPSQLRFYGLQDNTNDHDQFISIRARLSDRHDQLRGSPELLILEWQKESEPWLDPELPDEEEGYRGLELEISTVEGDPAAAVIAQRRPISAVSSLAAFQQIRTWLQECTETHQHCLGSKASPLPTRVIEVMTVNSGGSTSDVLRLRHTAGEKGQYVALSYCWGGPQEYSLRLDNLAEMQRGIVWEELPQTLGDAVTVTRGLGLRFLWIDALCIIQDSTEDRNRELRQMARIYEHAHLTVSAASAASCSEGFLQERSSATGSDHCPEFVVPFRVPGDDAAATGNVVLVQDRIVYPWEDPLTMRGWALQERVMSLRRLVYGTRRMRWECQQGVRLNGDIGEYWDNFRLDDDIVRPLIADSASPTPSPRQAPTSEDENRVSKNWYRLVEDYSLRSLTFEGDKLVAISAIASIFQRGFGENDYLAGLWRPALIQGLLWRRLRAVNDPPPKARSASYVAPSWSWASITEAVRFHFEADPRWKHFRVLSCGTQLEDHGQPTGAVRGGQLVVRGPLLRARLRPVDMEDYGSGGFRGNEGKKLPDINSPPAMIVMDAEEQRPDTPWLLWLTSLHGLILTKASVEEGGDGLEFRRVGAFCAPTTFGERMLQGSNAVGNVETITII